MTTIITVCGATGGQGGSVVQSFLKEKPGTYHVRAISRNVHSDDAQKLTSQGVEMVTADLNNRDSLIAAFKDSAIIFGTTNFFDTFPNVSLAAAKENEYNQGVNIAMAAAATPTLRHYIWSTMPDAGKLSGGKFALEHYDGKAQVDRYIREEMPELHAKTTFLWLPFFASVFTYPLLALNKVEASPKHVWLQPVPASTKLPIHGDHLANTGIWALATIKHPSLTQRGKYVLAMNEILSLGEMLTMLSDVVGKDAEHVEVSPEVYAALFGVFGELVARNFKMYQQLGDGMWYGNGRGKMRNEVVLGKEIGIEPGQLEGMKAGLVKYCGAGKDVNGV